MDVTASSAGRAMVSAAAASVSVSLPLVSENVVYERPNPNGQSARDSSSRYLYERPGLPGPEVMFMSSKSDATV